MPRVSIFRNIKETRDPELMDFFLFLENIRDGKWEDLVHQCRLIKDKEERDAFKRTMPTAAMSGEFSYRDDKSMIVHNGYLCLDIDHLENVNAKKKLLEEDRYTLSVFVSPSGDGLRLIVKVDPDKHSLAFAGVSTYLYDKYDIILDPNGKNVSKPYVVSYDPYIFINPFHKDVPVFKKYVKETPIKKIQDFVHTAGDFDTILSQIVNRRVNICDDYQDWLKIAFAISDQFGDDGRKAFHDISSVSSKYDFHITERQYNACMKHRGTGNTAKISTFYYLAKLNGVSITSEQTKAIVRATKHGKKAGLNKKQIAENLEKFSSIQGAEELVDKVYDQENQYESEEESILYQLEIFLSSNYSLLMNEVTGYIEHNGQQLTPSDLNSIFIAANKIMPKLQYPLMMRLLKSDFIESYNPFFKFFGSDGIAVQLPAMPDPNPPAYFSPLIDRLAESIQNNNPSYTLYFLRKWIVSIISSAHKVHSPLLLCLLGGQGTGKTEFFRRLLPPELKPYYAESKLDKEKDDELLMTENLVIMDDELGGKSKHEATKLKNITSKDYFSLRRPYGDHNEKILRLAVLCGTSNYKEILSDPTGNRRVIPIDVTDIDKAIYNSIDKKELFLEAFDLYKKGFDWRVGMNDVSYLNKDKEDYQQIIKERDLIQKYFTTGDDARLTSTDILVEIEIITRQKLNINAIGRELDQLGFVRKSTRQPNGATPKKWCVCRINRSTEVFTNGDLRNQVAEEEDETPF